ncbi:MAG: DUF1648 domain-containing protein [Oscillospiraceae bacterium]|nr:DUF1648 domain-containing protein [Oscillospiraceae bacterium]
MVTKLWHHLCTALGLALLLCATVFALLRWPALPDAIPTHYDAAGAATSYGGKGAFAGLLVTAWLLYAAMTVLSFFPQTWNLPKQTPRALQASADMLAVLRPLLAFLFGWIILRTAQGRALGVWFLPVTLGAVFVDLAVGLVRARR